MFKVFFTKVLNDWKCYFTKVLYWECFKVFYMQMWKAPSQILRSWLHFPTRARTMPRRCCRCSPPGLCLDILMVQNLEPGWLPPPGFCLEIFQAAINVTPLQVPEEVCDLIPQKSCQLATKLLPRLTPIKKVSKKIISTHSWKWLGNNRAAEAAFRCSSMS